MNRIDSSLRLPTAGHHKNPTNLTDTPNIQMTLLDAARAGDSEQEKLSGAAMKLQLKYGREIVKTGGELRAEKRVGDDF